MKKIFLALVYSLCLNSAFGAGSFDLQKTYKGNYTEFTITYIGVSPTCHIRVLVNGSGVVGSNSNASGSNTYTANWISATPCEGQLQVRPDSSSAWVTPENYTGEGAPVIPDEITGELSLDGFDSISYEIKVDSDGDGIVDKVVKNGVLGNDEGFSWTPDNPEQAYEVRALVGQMGEITVGLNQVIASGVGSVPLPLAPSIDYVAGGSLTTSTVGPDGQKTETKVSQGSVSFNAGEPVSTYSQSKPDGSVVTYTYNQNGSGASGIAVSADDIRMASALNSRGLDDIIALLSKGNQDREEMLDVVKDASTNSLGTLPFDPKSPVTWFTDKIPDYDLNNYSELAGSGVTRASSGNSFWQVSINGRVMNFDPASNPNVVVLANWIFTFITWAASIFLFQAVTVLMWETITELAVIPQVDPPDLQTEASLLGFGGSFNFGVLLFVPYAIFIVTFMVAANAVYSTWISTKLPIFSAAGAIGGGSSLFAAGGGSWGAAMDLFLWFVPVGHILTCFGTYLWFLLGRVPIYMSWLTVKTFLCA